MCKPEIKILICNESFTCDMHYSFRYTIPDAFDGHEMSAEVTFRTKLKYPVIHLISREQCNWISTLMDGCLIKYVKMPICCLAKNGRPTFDTWPPLLENGFLSSSFTIIILHAEYIGWH